MSQDSLEVFSKDTFLTSLRNVSGGSAAAPGSENGQSQSRGAVEEPEAMAVVRERHAQLHEVVGSLSEKISAVLGRQEKDFLAAYRAHMYNVQKELHDMREKMHRNETVENKTEKIKKIEEERDWYRKEALRLDAFTTSMTKDLKYMKEKLGAIEEDRNWLEKQLKACKKQNKLLRAELDVRLASPANVISAVESGVLPSFDAQSKCGSGGSSTISGGAAAVSKRPLKRNSETSIVGASNLSGALPYLSLDAPAHSPTRATEEREEKLKRQIKALKRELQQKTQELLVAKQQRSTDKDEEQRSHLEHFFIQCIESVKDEVVKRRHGGGGGSNGSGLASLDRKQQYDKTMQRASNADKARNQRYDVGPEFEDFTSADRVRLIERLLAHDQVLTFLYEHLFPSQPPGVSSVGIAAPSSSSNSSEKEREAMRGFSQRQFQTSESTVSLPDTALRSTDLFDGVGDGGGWSGASGDPARLSSSSSGSGAMSKPASGSGAAAVRGGGLPLDASTKEYLRSMRHGASSSIS